MENYYIDAQTGKSELVADRSDKANVSPQSISEYLCPFEISNEQKGAGGLVWHKAHYLYPLPIDQFQLTLLTIKLFQILRYIRIHIGLPFQMKEQNNNIRLSQ